MRQKIIITALVLIVIIIASIAICISCASLKDEAKIQAIDFAQRYVSFDIERHNHDLQVINNDNYYRVTGIIKNQFDLSHYQLNALLELRKSEKLWILHTLSIDGITLYDRD